MRELHLVAAMNLAGRRRNFIDRQIISILAQDIKHDLNLADAQIGFLYGTAFAVFYALFGIPLDISLPTTPETTVAT